MHMDQLSSTHLQLFKGSAPVHVPHDTKTSLLFKNILGNPFKTSMATCVKKKCVFKLDIYFAHHNTYCALYTSHFTSPVATPQFRRYSRTSPSYSF